MTVARGARPRGRRLLPLAALAGTVLVAAGCASDAPLDTLEPEGPDARSIDDFIIPVFGVAGIVLVFVVGGILFLAVRNRSRHDEDEGFPSQVHGNTRLEILWTAIPAAIMVVIAVGTVVVLSGLNSSEANAIEVSVDGETMMWEPTVVVVGQQWWWEYRYYFGEEATLSEFRESADPKDLPPADIVTSGQMVVPVDEEIELIVTARDVIHSHWIPRLNGKRDAVPGRFSPWKIQADEPGTYFGQCTEYCGMSHSRMRMQVIALDDAGFQEWVDMSTTPAPVPEGAEDWLASVRGETDEVVDSPAETAEQRGLVAFVANCASCHLVDGVNETTYEGANQVSGAAPDLTHFASRTTFAGAILPLYLPDGSLNRVDLEHWLRAPEEIKDMANNETPPRGMPNLGLSENTIDDLVAYLATLGPEPSQELKEQANVE